MNGKEGKSIEVTHGESGWDALLIAKRLPGWNIQWLYANQYKNLCFSFNPGNNLDNIDKLSIAIRDGGTFIDVIELIPEWDIMSNQDKINKWHKISVPLSRFIVDNERFFNLIFFNSSGTTLHYYLDDIYLEWEKDTSKPIISNISTNVSMDYTSADIQWSTNEYTKYVVEYGIDNYETGRIKSASSYAQMSHNVEITNLKPGNTYKYKITATDIQTIEPELNATVYEGIIEVEQAPNTPPVLLNTTIEETSLTYLKINFEINRACTMELYYGIENFENKVNSNQLNNLHFITIGNLLPNTTYNYYTVIKDSFGNAATNSALSFTTSNDYSNLKLHFTIDTVNGKKEISPYIYGSNNLARNKEMMSEQNLAFGRMGGNNLTPYNWENNASNAGEDWYNWNYNYIPWIYCEDESEYTIPGAPVRRFLETVQNNENVNASLVTIPILGYVAADSGIDADVNQTPNYLETRFKVSKARKDTGALSLIPNLNDNYVYQDEFINWMNHNFPNQKIFYSLDNEPDLWMYTHPRIHPIATTYEELVSKSIDYASMIKDMAPNSLVFGPASYGWYGYVALQGAPDANGRDFLDHYMAEMKQAETTYNKRILDVLDIHWYPEDNVNGVRVGHETNNTPEVAATRMQTIRSLWDESYIENSWIAENLGESVRLIPRMNDKINANYPGTKLAITEYYFGGGNHISGAIAQADALGVFGKYDVFAASLWHMGEDNRYIKAAFNMYRNYDSNGGSFGDIYVPSTTNDYVNTSIYASTENENTDKVITVLINKEGVWSDGDITINGNQYSFGRVYVLKEGSHIQTEQGIITPISDNKFLYSMPPYSITTIVFEK